MTGREWALGRLLGGWQEGAWLVSTADGTRAVLKVHQENAERVIAAADRVQRARSAGWPTPAWLALEALDDDGAWVLQEHVDGVRPPVLDERVARAFIGAFEIQRGLGEGGRGWGEWVCGAVFEDWGGYRASVADQFALGPEVVAVVDEIARRLERVELDEHDLVHGNFGIVNAVDDGRRLWLVDAATIGPGPVAYDVVEAIFTATVDGGSNPPGVDQLWGWAEQHLPSEDIAVCAGSLALTMAAAFHRLDADAEGARVAPWLLSGVERASRLVG